MEPRSIDAEFQNLGLAVPKVMLPRPGTDLTKWAIIACDQFTSDAGYWRRVEERVGSSPSALRLILPELYLDEPDIDSRVGTILASMNGYLQEGILEEQQEGFVLVRRRMTNGSIRTGLVAALDLERYDFRSGSTSLVRATEGTIPERIPPRTRVRRGAPLELPHVLVLYDDPQHLVRAAIPEGDGLRRLYDFELMENGGHITGDLVHGERVLRDLVAAFTQLADPAAFRRRHASGDLLLFAVGDGNHSLAAAKSVWEEVKNTQGSALSALHPGRHALVELVNIHDPGIQFEPIHRVLFGAAESWSRRLVGDDRIRETKVAGQREMMESVKDAGGRRRVGMVTEHGFSILEFLSPASTLPTAFLQAEIDGYLHSNPAVKVDYIHGEESAVRLGRQPGNIGFLLPAISKSSFFETIVSDGSLPRKTFSMGEAEEKRFYLEARRIVPN